MTQGSGKKRKNIVPRIVLGALLVLMAILAVILYFSFIDKGLVPDNYWMIYMLVIAGLVALSFIAMIGRWSTIVMAVVTALVSAVLVYGINFSDSFMKSISEVSGKTQTVSTLKIAVLKESNIENISELSGETIAYTAGTSTTEINKVETDVNNHVPGVTFEQRGSITALADALYNRDVTAVVINDSFVDMLSEIDGYNNFRQDIRIIHTVDIEKTITGAGVNPQSDVDVFTLYLSGIDTFGDTMKTSRSDVNVLAVVNMRTKHIQLINTPRDYYVELPNSNGEPDKLTHAALYGVDNSMGTLSMLYNTDINYFLRMNFSGFERIIDTLGGIDVESDYEFTSTLNPKYTYEKGLNHLNGEAALFFARERYAFAEGDNQRGRDHMAIITAVVKKLTSSPEILTNYQNIFGSLSSSFQTSMPQDLIYKMVNAQLTDSSEWDIDSYAVEGEGEFRTTFSAPNSEAYVTIPDEDTIYEAKDLIRQVKRER